MLLKVSTSFDLNNSSEKIQFEHDHRCLLKLTICLLAVVLDYGNVVGS